ncbi:MAG: hypothetical protein ABI891_04240, partial [Acidobacteriota bacterium]
ETPTERKKAFDKLLKVEEYRQGAEKLLETARYVENQINAVNIRIGRAEGELARFEEIENEHKIQAKKSAELSESAEKLNNEVTEKSEIVKKFDEAEKKVNELKTFADKLKTENAKAEIIHTQKENERNQAFAAQEKIKVVEEDYKTHVAALARLKELERERIERDKLNAEKLRVETAQINVKADQKKFREDLEKSLKAHQEISSLEPKIIEQEKFEKERENLRNRIADAKAAASQIKSLDEKMNFLRDSFRKNQTQIKEAETKSENAALFENLQKRDGEIINNLAKFRAKLEADEKFQSEISNGLCPILSEKCLNLKPGQTLESFVTNQFGEVRTQISTLENEKKQLADALRISREAGKFLATLETLRNREQEISEEGKRYKAEKEDLEKKAENLSKIETDLAEIENNLKVLDNPKAKVKLLQTEADLEITLREKITEVEKNLERLENDRGILLERLESYQFLDAQWKEFSDERDKTAVAHREFVINESLAKLLPQREGEFETATKELLRLHKETEKAENELAAASKDYDRDTHSREKNSLTDLEKMLAETRVNLEFTKKRADELEKDLNRLRGVRKAMQFEFQEKEKLEKVSEATKFIRDTLKEAAPRVARNYVHHVSLEANQMFREISGNA